MVFLFVLKNSRRRVRAQTSIETLIILAIGLFLLAVMTSLVYDQINSAYVREQQKVGLSTINLLAKEIDDTYFLGSGTVKEIVLAMPDLIDLNKSYIRDRSIVLSVAETDLVASTKINVRGTWPNISGEYSFVITAFGDFVAVSVQPLSFSRAKVSESVLQNSSLNFDINVTNVSDINHSYNLSTIFPSDSSTGATLTSTSLGLIDFSVGEKVLIPFSVVCEKDSFGSYSGQIIFAATTIADSNLSIPVNIICSSTQSKLMIFPKIKNVTVAQGGLVNTSVLLCNTTFKDLNSLTVSISGASSSFVGASFLSGVPAASCSNLALSIVGPVVPGEYLGVIKITSANESSSSDLNISVV